MLNPRRALRRSPYEQGAPDYFLNIFSYQNEIDIFSDISSQTHVGECLQSDINFHECSLYWTIMFSTPKVAMFSPSFFGFPQSSRVGFFF